ncbi:sulfite exporter TauE/SafE family protein [Bordetella petrii]|uniref:sulfite exporter TauE/SafE family protein n=1 Tax=Bordetella petrii TaxID=94624 RepID=UPI001E45BEB9|nr:sulfite exporter TauE/SafE family protein [Bordetella petrii]MCD0506185.1 sulfite exporter TauE/SafE family protein [Bordetella petrii]
MELWLLLAAGACAAAFVQGLAGFGFGLVAMAFWSWALPPAMAAPAVVFGSLIGQLLAVRSLRHGFDWRRLAPFLLGGLLGVPLGVALLRWVDPAMFRFGVGLVLMVYCPAMLLASELPRITRGGRAADALAGWLSGIMGGFGGLPGPVVTLWCMLRGWPRDQQRAVFQSFNLAMHGITLGSYAVAGLLTPRMAPVFGIVGIAVLVPALVGVHLYRRFSDVTFRRLVLVLLTLSGLALVVAGVRSF